MKLFGRAIVFGFAVATVSVAACSSHRVASTGTNQGPTGSTEDGTGSVGFQYTLPGGEHLTTITYTLTNGTNTYGPTVVNVGASSVISFVIPDVKAGTGYSITISGTSDDGVVSCSGSFGTGVSDAGQNNGAPFAVVARQSTVVNVQLVCIDVPNTQTGSVLVNGITSCCPTWDTMVANPMGTLSTLAPGNTASLTGNASGPCDGDAGFGVNLNCTWSVISGSGTVGATTTDNKGNFFSTFTCGTQGSNTVQLFCTDGPLPDGGFCPAALTTGSMTIICGQPTPCTQTGETGVVAVPNTAAGTCSGTDPSNGKQLVNSGVADSQGNFCCVDACGGGPTATPFSPTGLCTAFPGTSNDGKGCCVLLHPCTTVGDTNCVQCQLNDTAPNANKTCTPTEAKIVAYDIKQGQATAPGPDPAGSCYTCLAQNSCLDDTHLGDTNLECEDGNITTGTAALCEAVIDCIFGSNMGMGTCAKTSVATCYCGTAPLTLSCQGNPSAANGVCAPQIAAALGFPTQDGTDNTAHFTDAFRAGGAADQIFSCAHTNNCTACYN
jgi:hypothetical protein